jgi:penicillin-binding protein 2
MLRNFFLFFSVCLFICLLPLTTAISKESNVLRGSIFDRNGKLLVESLPLSKEEMRTNPNRVYRYGKFASQLIGFGNLAETFQESEQTSNAQEYFTGRRGIEKIYDKGLRAGSDIHLTIDYDIQEAAEKALGNKPGAAVVMEINTGKILSLASSPRLDPYDFLYRISWAPWQRLLEDYRRPLVNKPTQGQYPPGTMFKIITAYAGLKEQNIRPDTKYHCTGYIVGVGDARYYCTKETGHGEIDLIQAFSQSCDTYFYWLGLQLGADNIASSAKRFGLGAKTDIDIDYEKAGHLLTSEWKEEVDNESITSGEVFATAIGQGYTLVTPLQTARMIAAVANGGVLYKPYLVSSIKNGGDRNRIFKPQRDESLLDAELLSEIIKSGFSPKKLLENKHIASSCIQGEALLTISKQNKNKQNHYWLSCFAPTNNPTIAITVLEEHAIDDKMVLETAKAILKEYAMSNSMH